MYGKPWEEPLGIDRLNLLRVVKRRRHDAQSQWSHDRNDVFIYTVYSLIRISILILIIIFIIKTRLFWCSSIPVPINRGHHFALFALGDVLGSSHVEFRWPEDDPSVRIINNELGIAPCLMNKMNATAPPYTDTFTVAIRAVSCWFLTTALTDNAITMVYQVICTVVRVQFAKKKKKKRRTLDSRHLVPYARSLNQSVVF